MVVVVFGLLFELDLSNLFHYPLSNFIDPFSLFFIFPFFNKLFIVIIVIIIIIIIVIIIIIIVSIVFFFFCCSCCKMQFLSVVPICNTFAISI